MKKIKMLTIFTILAFASFTATAQDYIEGDKKLTFLAGQTKFNVEYNYDNMIVGEKTEKQYVAEKKKTFNEKELGKGEKWESNWFGARKDTYEPLFEELFNKMLDGAATISQKATGVKYTIFVKTLDTEPGYNVVIHKKNPYCHLEISFIDNTTKKVMAKCTYKAVGRLMGGDFNFDPKIAIKECYAKAGKEIGKDVAKALGK